MAARKGRTPHKALSRNRARVIEPTVDGFTAEVPSEMGECCLLASFSERNIHPWFVIEQITTQPNQIKSAPKPPE